MASSSSYRNKHKLVIKIYSSDGSSRFARVRVSPDETLAGLREEIANQLVEEDGIPSSYFFQYFDSDKGIEDLVDISRKQET